MTNRIPLCDNLKFLLIVTVVVGHFADVFTNISPTCRSIYLFIYAFHMPLFLYISGMFHSNKNVVKKVLFYVSIGFLIKLLLLCSSVITGGTAAFSLLSDKGIPWFMFVIAMFTAAVYVLKEQNKWYVLIFSVILACLVGYDKSISDYLYLSRAIVFFPFYWFGYMTSPDMWMEIKSRHRAIKICISLIIIAAWFYCAFARLDFFYNLRHLFTGRNHFSAYVYDYGPLARLLCYGITSLIGVALIILTPSKKIPIISDMGTRTIDVLVWHWPIYIVLNYFIHLSSLFSGKVGKIAFLFSGVLLSLILLMGGPFSYPAKWIKKCIFTGTGNVAKEKK